MGINLYRPTLKIGLDDTWKREHGAFSSTASFRTNGQPDHVNFRKNAFRSYWNGRLGLTLEPGVPKEHWKRVEALTRRVTWSRDEYDTLRPVADLLKMVSDQIYHFLKEPPPQEGLSELRQEIIDAIAREAYVGLHTLIRRRMLN